MINNFTVYFKFYRSCLPECILLCAAKSPCWANDLSHVPHEYGFSPLFHIWIKEKKRQTNIYNNKFIRCNVNVWLTGVRSLMNLQQKYSGKTLSTKNKKFIIKIHIGTAQIIGYYYDKTYTSTCNTGMWFLARMCPINDRKITLSKSRCINFIF